MLHIADNGNANACSNAQPGCVNGGGQEVQNVEKRLNWSIIVFQPAIESSFCLLIALPTCREICAMERIENTLIGGVQESLQACRH